MIFQCLNGWKWTIFFFCYISITFHTCTIGMSISSSHSKMLTQTYVYGVIWEVGLLLLKHFIYLWLAVRPALFVSLFFFLHNNYIINKYTNTHTIYPQCLILTIITVLKTSYTNIAGSQVCFFFTQNQ